MERSEEIDDKGKYQQKLSFRTRAQKFLRKNIIWLPVICGLMGLVGLLYLYQRQFSSPVSLGLDLGKYINREQYRTTQVSSKLNEMKDRIRDEEQVAIDQRYDRIISGKDVVSVNFRNLIHAEEPVLADTVVPKKDSVVVDTVQQVKPVRKAAKAPRPVAQVVKTDTVVVADSLTQDTVPVSYFNTIKVAQKGGKDYTVAYVNGDQELISGTYIKLRLGENLHYQGQTVPRGTVFNGRVNVVANAVYITIERIQRYNVDLEVYDGDYSRGIITAAKSNDMEEAINQSVYRSSGRTVADLPYEVVQDVASSILRKKRRKQSVPTLNDGYQVYIAQEQG